MNKSADDSSPPPAVSIVAVLLVVAAFYFGRELFIPLLLATFFAFLLVPAVRFFEHRRLGRVASVSLVVGLSLGSVVGVGWIVISQAASLASEIPKYKHNLNSKLEDLRGTAGDEVDKASKTIEDLRDAVKGPGAAASPQFDPETQATPTVQGADPSGAETTDPPELLKANEPSVPEEEVDADAAETDLRLDSSEGDEDPIKVEVVSSKSDILRRVGALAAPVLHPFATAGITVIFVVFFLIHREDLRDRFLRLCGQAHINVTTAALTESAVRVTRYLSSLALVNVFTGITIGIGLFFIGVPNAVLWGLLATLLRFVPFLGPWLAAIFPLTVSVALLESWTQPILVATLFIVIEVVCVNLLEPWFYGARMGVSPVAVFFSFVFWTWLWGAVGLFMAMPITVCLVVFGKFVPAFGTFYILLGNEPVLEPATRLYQRLLAMDRDEALKLGRNAVQEQFVDGCDTVLLPALAQIESDHRDNLVDERRLEFVKKTVRELVEGLATEPPEPAAEDGDGSPLVLLVPTEGALARCVAELLVPAMGPAVRTEITGQRLLPGEVATIANEGKPDVVTLIAVEPRMTRRLAQECERMSIEAPDASVLVLVVAATSLAAKEKRAFSRLGRNIRVLHSTRELISALQG